MQVERWDGRDGAAGLLKLILSTDIRGSFTVFRGHADAAWGLTPSLYRYDRKEDPFPQSHFMVGERQLIEAFFARSELWLKGFKRNSLNDLVIAQHYGVPTRLLDWTTDPMIALFFAVEDRSEADAAIFVLDTDRFETSSIAVGDIYDGPVLRINPPLIDERVMSQKSVFTIQSYGPNRSFLPLDQRDLAAEPGGHGTRLAKIVIPAEQKAQVMLDLLFFGVDASIVYPGLEGVGRRLRSLVQAVGYGNDIF